MMSYKRCAMLCIFSRVVILFVCDCMHIQRHSLTTLQLPGCQIHACNYPLHMVRFEINHRKTPRMWNRTVMNRVILREWGVMAWSEESWNIFQVHVHKCSVGLTWIAHTFINSRDVYAPIGNMTCWYTSSSNTGLKTRANYLAALSCIKAGLGRNVALYASVVPNFGSDIRWFVVIRRWLWRIPAAKPVSSLSFLHINQGDSTQKPQTKKQREKARARDLANTLLMICPSLGYSI